MWGGRRRRCVLAEWAGRVSEKRSLSDGRTSWRRAEQHMAGREDEQVSGQWRMESVKPCNIPVLDIE
jgi:hypothetical protein